MVLFLVKTDLIVVVVLPPRLWRTNIFYITIFKGERIRFEVRIAINAMHPIRCRKMNLFKTEWRAIRESRLGEMEDYFKVRSH